MAVRKGDSVEDATRRLFTVNGRCGGYEYCYYYEYYYVRTGRGHPTLGRC